MALTSGKRLSKKNNVEQLSAAELMLESLSGASASQAVDDSSSLQPSAEVSDVQGSESAVLQRTRSVKKKNYTDPEMEVLVDEIIANYKTLFPAKTDKCPMPVRSAVWNDIMNKVNALGVAKRTVPELKKKWADLKKKVKAKMAAISRYSRQTGGGPSCPEQLTTLEEKIGATCRREQIEGFGTADVCMLALGQSETNLAEGLEDQTTDEPAVETMEQAHSDVADDNPGSSSAPSNPPLQTRELLLPADLGLTEPQTTYINDYTNEHLQFMRRVDSKFDNLEKGFQTLAEAYLSGANTISQGLNKIANLLESQKSDVTPRQNYQTPSISTLVDHANPVDQFRTESPPSPSSVSIETSLGSAITLPSNFEDSASPSNTVLLNQDGSSSEALDLSLPTQLPLNPQL